VATSRSGFRRRPFGEIMRHARPDPPQRSSPPDRWDIYFGDVAVGSIGRCAGVPVHDDKWEWGCGLYPGMGPDRVGAAPPLTSTTRAPLSRPLGGEFSRP
jgi:hypothetical protein